MALTLRIILILCFADVVRVHDGIVAMRPQAEPGQHYVHPAGRPSNDGGPDTPWDLATALAHPAAVRPGDTIWLRGGIYQGSFSSRLAGLPGAPIVVRQFPGERATIDANGGAEYALTVRGEWAWYWGFEITSSDPNRTSPSPGSNPVDFKRASGVSVLAPHTRFINLVVHDTNQAFGFWTPAIDSELYGNIVYFNGWDASDRGHGHGVYAQNQTGTKHIADNIIFDQFSHGIHIYTEGGFINGFDVSGNIVFNNGVVSRITGPTRNILIGGGRMAENLRVVANSTYFPFDGAGDNTIGYDSGCSDLRLRGNYFASPIALILNNCGVLEFAKNTLHGQTSGFDPADFPDNLYISGKSAGGAKVIIRHNRYDPKLSYLAVYNWDHRDRVYVDASILNLRPGDRYEIREVQDYYGNAVSRIYDEDVPIDIPMVNWPVAEPVGAAKPATTLPEFGAFVITTRNGQTTHTHSASTRAQFDRVN